MLFLGYESAVQYWRTVRAGLVPHPSDSRITVVADEDHLLKEIRDSVPDLPIEGQVFPQILISQKKHCHRSDDIGYHYCPAAFPEGSFYQHTYGVSVSSPELCLVQAAQTLGNSELITLLELCCEFMGCYSLCEKTVRGFIACEPLITRDQVFQYLDKLPRRTRGATLLHRALRLVGEGSRSPRETECFLAMTLPPKKGGFGLPRPTMNHPILLEGEDGNLSDSSLFLADLLWEEAGTIFEYDGSYDHSGAEQVARDKERRSVLASMGYRAIVAFNASMSDDSAYLKKIAQVFRALEIPMPRFNEAEVVDQSRLRRFLFNPQHHYRSAYTTPIVPEYGLSEKL